MTEKEKKILAMQSPSMQRIMRKSLSIATKEDLEWKPKFDVRAVPEAKSVEEALGFRSLGIEETAAYLDFRRNRGKPIEQMHIAAFKQIPASFKGRIPKHIIPETVTSLGDAKKMRAIDAFMGVFSIHAIKKKFFEIMKPIDAFFKIDKEETVIERARREAGINEE